MKIFITFIFILLLSTLHSDLFAQQKWINVDTAYGDLPDGFHVYKTTDSVGGKPFIAYYAEAGLKDRKLIFTTDTTSKRRITPKQFFEKDEHPLLVVNGGFFSYETNNNLNVVIRNGKLLAYNTHTLPMHGKDTFQYRHPFGGALGIDKKGNADVAWIFTDPVSGSITATQAERMAVKDSIDHYPYNATDRMPLIGDTLKKAAFKKWNMQTAIGGGPVLVQEGKIHITNEEEVRFNGKAINDTHPRTCMGYTADGRLIVMVIAGRFPGIAMGATLPEEAKLLADLGCVEAINLDGGGSSCMLINGKETIKPSTNGEERPVPGVFIIKKK